MISCDVDNITKKRLHFSSLYISQLSSRPVGILMGFILTDIAITYGTTVGVVGQIVTIASLAGLAISPFLAALSIKYNPRILLIAGILLNTISAIGCSLAPNYSSMLIFYTLNGLGVSIIPPMVLTIIGETIPEKDSANIIGKINTSNPTLSTFAGLTIAYILRSGWQSAYLTYAFPIMLVSLIIAVLFLPKAPQIKEAEKSTSIREGLNSVIGYRSALVCLFGSTLTRLVFGGMMWYVVSFYKEIWGVSTSNVGLLWSANTSVYVIGNLISGGIVSRIGYKRSTSLSSLILGLCFIVFTNVSFFQVAVAMNLFFSFVAAFWITGASALALGQVPKYKGAMMSLHSGSIQLGNALGSAFGGLFIAIGGYGLMGFFMGVLAIISSLSVSYLAHDPIQVDFSSQS